MPGACLGRSCDTFTCGSRPSDHRTVRSSVDLRADARRRQGETEWVNFADWASHWNPGIIFGQALVWLSMLDRRTRRSSLPMTKIIVSPNSSIGRFILVHKFSPLVGTRFIQSWPPPGTSPPFVNITFRCFVPRESTNGDTWFAERLWRMFNLRFGIYS